MGGVGSELHNGCWAAVGADRRAPISVGAVTFYPHWERILAVIDTAVGARPSGRTQELSRQWTCRGDCPCPRRRG
jgi:hypothetical protein